MKSRTRKSLYEVYPDGFSKMQKCSLRIKIHEKLQAGNKEALSH